MILTDEVADRVHRLAVANLRATAEAAARVRSDAVGADLGTGFALFAGAGSPLTQVVGFAYREAGDPQAIEAFFNARCETWEATATPFTHGETFRALVDAGYRPAHFEADLAQWVGDVPEPKGDRAVEIVEVEGDLATWMETTGRSWSETEDASYEPDEVVRVVAAATGRKYLAFVDGQPAATASLWEFEEGVMLGGAATRVPFRGRGLQTALLHRRLRDAGRGRFALIGAVPGTPSYRNAQRVGFTPLYSKVTMTR